MKRSTFQSIILSIVAPSLVVFLGVQSSYWLNIRSNLATVEMVYSILAMCIGVYTFFRIKIISRPKLLVVWVIYVLILISIIFWAGLLTACGNGDCL